MAQELFITEEILGQRRYNALIQRGMSLWNTTAEEYRTLPFKYLFLVTLSKERGTKIKPITKSKLEDYPDIEFLKILGKSDALEWLMQQKSADPLERTLDKIDLLLETSYAYSSMKSWIIDVAYRLENGRPSAFSLAR